MRNIFHAINALEYQDRPNYTYIREQLLSMLNIERQKEVVSIEQFVGKRKLKTPVIELERQPKYLKDNKGYPVPIFKIDKPPTALAPQKKTVFEVFIDVEYYKKLYAN